jgi:transcriptional regulator with XRE-family HTH domain
VVHIVVKQDAVLKPKKMKTQKTISEIVVAEVNTFFQTSTMSKAVFAKECGITRMQLWNIMNGKYPPRGARLKRIIWALDKYGHPLPEGL